PGEIILPESDERIGDEGRLRPVRIVVRMAVGDAAEILEGAQVAAWHALAGGVHAAELPLRDRIALLGRVLQRNHALGGIARLHRLRAAVDGGLDPAALEAQRRIKAAREAEHQNRYGTLNNPHNTTSRPRP